MENQKYLNEKRTTTSVKKMLFCWRKHIFLNIHFTFFKIIGFTVMKLLRYYHLLLSLASTNQF